MPLRERGYWVVTLDAPGHGLSPGMATHLVDSGNTVAALMTQFGRFQAIIAHSYGAAATANLLARQPEWITDHLTLVSPTQDIRQHLAIFASIAGLSLAGWNCLQQRVQDLLGQPLDDICTLAAAGRLIVPGLDRGRVDRGVLSGGPCVYPFSGCGSNRDGTVQTGSRPRVPRRLRVSAALRPRSEPR